MFALRLPILFAPLREMYFWFLSRKGAKTYLSRKAKPFRIKHSVQEDKNSSFPSVQIRVHLWLPGLRIAMKLNELPVETLDEIVHRIIESLAPPMTDFEMTP
jgi:hypothetical protein